MYSLYYAPGAASMVVHWLLIELELKHELRLVDTKAGEHKTEEYLAINPNGVVPTLLVDGRKGLYETAGLLMFLADRHEGPNGLRLAPRIEDEDRGCYCQWILNLANTVQSPMRLWWYPTDIPGAPEDAIKDSVRTRVEAAWDRIDAHLAKSGPYLLGQTLSAADFYLVMLMRWTRNMPRPADQWQHLANLAQRLKARPSFATLYERECLTEWV